MPQGKGTYGSQVGRPPKKQTAKKNKPKLKPAQLKIAKLSGDPKQFEKGDFKKLRSMKSRMA